MTDRLEQLNHRYEELSAQLSAPETYDAPELVARLNREQRELEPVVECYRALQSARQDLHDAEELLHDADPEVRELAKEEYPALKERLEHLEEHLHLLFQMLQRPG